MQKVIPSGFQFNGRTGEWFGIWIVNLLLSIATLGIYSAWAKVRAKKYFYQNTYLNGRNFDYHATGGQILKGRLIVIAALILFQLIFALLPWLGLLILLLMIPAFPWLMNKALTFNARQSSFSNVRFDFNGDYWGAIKAFLFYPIGAVLTMYLALPLADRAGQKYVIGNHRLGRSNFDLNIGIKPFYVAFGFAVLWVVLCVIAFILLVMGSISVFGADRMPSTTLMVIITYSILIFIMIPARMIYSAFTILAVYNAVQIDGGHQMQSDINPWRFIWIAVSNVFVVLFTLGLMLPWAQVRMARYMADHVSVLVNGTLDGFIAGEVESGSALGDAYADIEGFDLGVPL